MTLAAGDKIIALHTTRGQIPLVGTLENIDSSTGTTFYSVVLYGPQGEIITTQVTNGRIWAIADGTAPTPIKPIVGAGNNSTPAVSYASNLRLEI